MHFPIGQSLSSSSLTSERYWATGFAGPFPIECYYEEGHIFACWAVVGMATGLGWAETPPAPLPCSGQKAHPSPAPVGSQTLTGAPRVVKEEENRRHIRLPVTADWVGARDGKLLAPRKET